MQTRDPIDRRAALMAAAAFFVLAPLHTAWAQPEESEKHAEKLEGTEHESDDVTSWEASLGGTHQSGNTQTIQVNAGSYFELFREPHGFLAEANFVYGQAVVDEEGDNFEKTAENLRGRLRYDFFLSRMDALFAAVSVRRDPFAGLDVRLQATAGYLRNFFKAENHRFWGEIGYDMTYDNFHPDPLVDDMGNILAGDQIVHSGRGFLGYNNELTRAATFRTGLEVLVNVETPGDVRINWENALRSQIVDQLQLEVKLTMLADTQPVPGAESVDTITSLNLVYSLL